MVKNITTCDLCSLPVLVPVPGPENTNYCCHACKEVAILLKESPLPAAEAGTTGQLQHVTMNIGGLWCASCAWLVEERLKRTPGVTAARVSFLERKARISFDEGRISLKRITRRIRSFGYRAGQGDDEEEEDRFFTRMLVGGLLAMHIMVVSVIMYVRDWMGLSSPDSAWMEHFFYAMQFVLSIPLSVLLGFPILRAGLNSLIRGLPNVQTLVALGSIAALGLSARNLFLQSGHVYFDTAAMLFFLLTVGRWLEIKAHQSGQTAFNALTAALPKKAARVGQDRVELVPVEDLEPGHRIRIRPGDYIPVDGIIARGTGEIDESLLNGEPSPVIRGLNEPVYAGSHNLDGTFDLIVSKTGEFTRAGQIRQLLDGLVWQRSPAERLADRFAARMVYVAILIAGLTFAGHYFVNGLEKALLNSLSVLLIACPCALGIATPLTLWQAVGRAAENGVLLRSSGLFEKLMQIKRVYFDKTGTLTEMPHSVQNIILDGETGAEKFLETVAALEQFSTHPFGQAILTHYSKPLPASLQVSGFHTVPGAGVFGCVNGMDVYIGSRRLMQANRVRIPGQLESQAIDAQAAGQITIYAGWDGRVHGVIIIGERLRSETRAVLLDLINLGLSPEILTGDTIDAGLRWKKMLHIPVQAGLLPEEKLEIVQRYAQHTMMVGDGINDGPALAAAGIGVAMVHGTDVARSAAEITLVDDDLHALPWLFHLSTETRRKLYQNLAWSAVYNIVGIGLAVAGLLQPVLAALAMVLSSTFVTRNALRLRKYPSWKSQVVTAPPSGISPVTKTQKLQETA